MKKIQVKINGEWSNLRLDDFVIINRFQAVRLVDDECKHERYWDGKMRCDVCKPSTNTKIEKLDMENNEYNFDHTNTGNMFSRKREIITLARKLNETIDKLNGEQ